MGNYRTGTSNYRGGVKTYGYRQTSDLTVNNSETYVNTDLKTPTLTIGKSYIISGYLLLNSGTTPDLKLKLNITSLNSTQALWELSSSSHPIPINALATEDTSVPGAGASVLHFIIISILDVTVAGTFQLQMAQNVADVSDTKVRKGSYWIIKEI